MQSKRVQEMLSFSRLITTYTETHVRPSLSDMYAFDLLLGLIRDDHDDVDYVILKDIDAIWTGILESDTVFTLQDGPEYMFDSLIEYLEAAGHLVFKEDLEEADEIDGNEPN